MKEQLERLFLDLGDFDLPRHFDKAMAKMHCPIRAGMQVAWYYKDEAEFWKKDHVNPRVASQWAGIIVPRPDMTMTSPQAELEIKDAVLVITFMPAEKCYPESEWVALNRFLDDDDLVAVYEESPTRKMIRNCVAALDCALGMETGFGEWRQKIEATRDAATAFLK